MVLAYSAEGSQRHLDLDGYATIGGNILGAAIPMAVVVVLAEMARPNRSVPRAAYG